MTETRAEIRLPTQELRDDLPFYTKTLGIRLDMIYPGRQPGSGGAVRPWAAAADREGRAQRPRARCAS